MLTPVMTRNLWGWGHVEAAISPAETQARIEPLFGASELEAAAEPRLPPMRVGVPREVASFSSAHAEVRAAHAMGKAYPDRLRGFRGDFSTAPDFVALPRDEHELALVLEVAAREQLSVTPFGGGSSVVAGVEPRLGPNHVGALSLDLCRLDRVLELDDVSRVARIQAGAFGPALEEQLAAHGFTLRHFPQSFEFSTLGGWIATRAGGHFATGPTHVDELVQAVRLVAPRGVLQTKTVPASGAGPDANRLVIGSEGALGVITEAWVRVRPRPTFKASAAVHFDDFPRAVEATRAIAQSGLAPSNCRLLDAQEALINGVSVDGASAVLVLGFESADHPVDAWLERALALATSLGGTSPEGKTSEGGRGDAVESWRASFMRGPYLQDALIRLGILADTFETACTWKAFPTLYAEVTEAMRAALERRCGGGAISCRFTHLYPDGPAPYFTFLGRARRGGELELWGELKKVASDAVTRAGGTITHHHAVGRTHRPWFDRERSPLFASALRAVKRELDPLGLLNPGVLLD